MKPKRLRSKNVIENPGYCELCGLPEQRTGLEKHHVISRGSGGPDHPCNMLYLCAAACHPTAHAGRIAKVDMFAVIAEREGMSIDDVINTAYRLKRIAHTGGNHGND